MPKPNQNPDTQKAKLVLSLKSRTLLVAGVILTVLIIGGLVWRNTLDNKNAEKNKDDCIALSREATDLLAQKQNQAAYDKLKSDADSCSRVKSPDIKKPDHIKDYVNLIQYNHDLAVAAYAAGNKAQAKIYADQGVKLSEARTSEQTSRITQDQVSKLNEFLFDMYRMQDGTYVYKPPIANTNGSSQ